MTKSLPSRREIAAKITALVEGELSRDAVVAWATTIILDDGYELSDAVSWNVIKALGGADIVGTDRPYLFCSGDFQNWLNALKQTRVREMR